MLEKLQCKNCGGTINPSTLKCEYCGTQYAKKTENSITHYIQTCPAKIHTLASKTVIADELLIAVPQEHAAEFAMKQITLELAKALTPFIKLEVEQNPFDRTQIIRGAVRVVEPDFRF